MSQINGSLFRGAPVYSSAKAKFGAAGQAGGVYSVGGVDAALGAVGAAFGTWSAEAWFRSGGSIAAICVIAGHDRIWWIGANAFGNAEAHISHSSAGGEINITSTLALGDNAWHHLALTLDGTTARFYGDGTLLGSAALAGRTIASGSSAPALIGGFSSASTFDMPSAGAIDEVRFSNVARYTGSTYSVPAAAFAPDANTVALYRFESDATDYTPNPPSIGTITVSSAGGTDTITFPAPVAGALSIASVALYEGTAANGESPTAVATSSGAGGGTFTRPGPVTGSKYYIVRAVDSAGNVSPASNEVVTAVAANVLPNDANIVYSPYNWLVTSASAKTINAGAYLRATITGSPSAIVALFDISNDLSPIPQLSISVDGGPFQSQEITNAVTIPIPSDNTWTKHTVEIRVKSTTETRNRWNSPQNTAVLFQGFTTLPGTCVTAPTRRRKLFGLLYGDSIAEGVRTLNMTATKDTDRNDSASAWALPLGALLGAEVGVVGFGGSGVGVPGNGNVPVTETSYAQLWSGQARNFISPQAPDFVVIHSGTNGSTSTDLTANMRALLNGLLAATPKATRIMVLPNWLQRHSAQFAAAVASCNDPTRVWFVDTTGWWNVADSADNLHPYGYINLSDIAPRLAGEVRAMLAAGSTWIKTNGQLKRVGTTRL